MNDEQHTNLPATTPFDMIARVVDHGADPATLERLLAMHERWEANEARKAFYEAIAKARAEIGPIFKKHEARFGPGKAAYRFEGLDDIEREIVPPLSKYGLSYRFDTKADKQSDQMWIIVACRIEHKKGHHEENSLPGQPDISGNKNALHAMGSTVTYLKKITLKAALGLSTTEDMVDDDGAGGAEELCSENEVAMLRKRIEQVGQSEERVCAFYKISKLENLPASQFDSALKKLDASAKT